MNEDKYKLQLQLLMCWLLSVDRTDPQNYSVFIHPALMLHLHTDRRKTNRLGWEINHRGVQLLWKTQESVNVCWQAVKKNLHVWKTTVNIGTWYIWIIWCDAILSYNKAVTKIYVGSFWLQPPMWIKSKHKSCHFSLKYWQKQTKQLFEQIPEVSYFGGPSWGHKPP